MSKLSDECYVWPFLYVRPSGRVLLPTLWAALPSDWASTEETLLIGILMSSEGVFVYVLDYDYIAVGV